MITVIWLAPVIINSILSGMYPLPFFVRYYELIVFAFYFIILFVVVVCYTSVCLRVRWKENWLVLYLLSLQDLWLCSCQRSFSAVLGFPVPSLFPSFQSVFIYILMVTITFIVANSLRNPMIYAIRMPEERTGVLVVVFPKGSETYKSNQYPTWKSLNIYLKKERKVEKIFNQFDFAFNTVRLALITSQYKKPRFSKRYFSSNN